MASKQDSPRRRKQKKKATQKLEKWREKKYVEGTDSAQKKS